jgi:hypothetical protein
LASHVCFTRCCGLVAAVALVAGCARDCTEMGCINGVSIQVGPEFAIELLPIEVVTCAAGVCNTATIQPSQAAPDRSTIGVAGSVDLKGTRERDVEVSLQIRSLATGAILVSGRGTGHLVRSQPNGAGCGPVCFGTVLAYDDATRQLIKR